MAHIKYSRQHLESLTLPQLKEIAAQIGTKATVDKRYKQAWIVVILRKQEALQKVEEVPQPTSEEILENQRFSEEVCGELCLRVYDLELEYGDVVIPPHKPAWEVRDFSGAFEGYIYNDRKTYRTDAGVFDDPYTAALSLVSEADLVTAKAAVVKKRQERELAVDYI